MTERKERKRKENPQYIKNKYLDGWLVRELMLEHHLGRMTIYRYFKKCGGITLEERCQHLINAKKREEAKQHEGVDF